MEEEGGLSALLDRCVRHRKCSPREFVIFLWKFLAHWAGSGTEITAPPKLYCGV